ncbi:PAS domain-containing protein [Pedobacter faecalis]|uniref:PAS domain-containing protein n=1 Tax=Pedobacter faecalis TaxID=3041495 RepID=UPI00254E6DA4|nr:PAS domain-containing protein [Pedobacter sp. ELA7]
MEHITTPIFQALFQSDVPRIILRANSPEFTILDYNSAHMQATGIGAGSDHRGKSLWQVYDPVIAGENGPELVSLALNQAIDHNTQVHMPVFRYDMRNEAGEVVPSWWQLEILPVKKNSDDVEYLLITTQNVTQAIRAEHREQELTEELAASNEELAAANEELTATVEDLKEAHDELEKLNAELEAKIEARVRDLARSETSLRSLVMTAHYPLMILRGREWVIEIVNQPLVNLWDRSIEEVTGRQLMEILPELEAQPFPGYLRQVYETGIGYGQEEQIFYYNSPSGPAEKYVSFYYDPLRDDQGNVCGIIVAADDITAKVQQRQLLEASLENEQVLTEQLNAINEELTAAVEDLSASNEDLIRSQHDLQDKHQALTESEARFRSLIRQAPIGICVLRASDLMVQEVNDGYLELVGKDRAELENRTIWEAVSEAAESYAPVMDHVIRTGQPFVAKEHEVVLIKHGIPQTVFIDFVYEPVVNQGQINTIMVVAIDVTEQVKGRRSIEDVEERIRLAVDAAEIGTFEHNYLTNALLTSERFDAIFGFPKPSSRLDLLPLFHPDDVHLSKQAHIRAARDGHMFYEARLIAKDQSIRWIRVQAKVYFQSNGIPEKLLGTVLDITDFKKLQQQKDDFISIASHELKTPITALKASLQLMQRLKDNPSAAILPRLIDQAGRSMDKISALIDDLLNVSRMNEGSMRLNKTTFLLKKLLDECCGHVRVSGTHELIFEGDEELEVYADEHRIDQVVVNFVNNAVKYAPDSRYIYLIAERVGNTARVAVRDNGPGISADKLPHLFERYYRADESGYQVSGLGLGLYISADIIQRHGGEIGVDSKLGAGSTFWFTLPIGLD